MLIDLLSQSNYGNYNIKLAELFGLEASVYLTELICIYEKALRKNKLTEEGFCKIERKYITSRTTIEANTQKEIDIIFSDYDILTINSLDKNLLKLKLDNLVSLALAKEEELDRVKINKQKIKRTSKVEAIATAMKRYIKSTNPEIRDAYYDWIDSILFNSKGALSQRAVQTFENKVDTFANHNLDIALAVIEKAIIHSYVDADWAINLYKKDNPANNFHSLSNQNINNTTMTLTGNVY